MPSLMATNDKDQAKDKRQKAPWQLWRTGFAREFSVESARGASFNWGHQLKWWDRVKSLSATGKSFKWLVSGINQIWKHVKGTKWVAQKISFDNSADMYTQRWGLEREAILSKSLFSFRHCPNHPPSPPSPIACMTEKVPMVIMMVEMIIMMVILVMLIWRILSKN